MTDRLIALADGRRMGEIRKDRRGRLTFIYDEDWRKASDAFPLSLSMPLIVSEHPHARIEPWLWNLLPDNETVLARWGQRFQVSPRNPFALLAHVGEDCAGAIQLISPEREATLGKATAGDVDWLNDNDIAERLKLLRQDQSAWRLTRDTGQFSLAGAQPKIALLQENGRWGIPSGRLPTTHIVKPPIEGFDGHAENEHICLALSRELGLPSASSGVRSFAGETAIVVERYDRVRAGEALRRLHQEDMCQALGLPPTKKYENEGGPSAASIVGLLRATSTNPGDDVWAFVKALVFNWLIGGTDAHAKNYSLLIGANGQTRLSPLYDLASSLPYDLDVRKLKVAMKVGGKYLLDEISVRHWSKLATTVRLNPEDVREASLDLVKRFPDGISEVVKQARANGLNRPIVSRLSETLIARSNHCRALLESGTQ